MTAHPTRGMRLLPAPPRPLSPRLLLALLDAGERGARTSTLLLAGFVLAGAALGLGPLLSPAGVPVSATVVENEPWPGPSTVLVNRVPLSLVSLRLPDGQVGRAVVPAASAASLQTGSSQWANPRGGTPPAVSVTGYRSLHGGGLVHGALLCALVAVVLAITLRAATQRWRLALWSRGQEVMASVIESHTERLVEGEIPVGFRVSVRWGAAGADGQSLAGSVRGFWTARLPLIDAGDLVPVLVDPEQGRGLPVALLPRVWSRPTDVG